MIRGLRAHEHQHIFEGLFGPLEGFNASYIANLVLWARGAAQRYEKALATIHSSIASEATRFQTECKKWATEVRAVAKEFKDELAKHGLT